MKDVKYQKRVKLKDFSYKGFYRYFVTVNTDRRRPVFEDIEIVGGVLSILKAICKDYGFIVWAYCFMPEHLHLLIEGKNEDSDMRKFVSMFKQKTSYVFKRQIGRKLWQENYYEHVLRKDEDTKHVARYIFENPVRGGLVDNFIDYPF